MVAKKYYRLAYVDLMTAMGVIRDNPTLANGRLANVHFAYFMTNPTTEISRLPEVFALADLIGRELLVTFRLMPSPAPDGWIDVTRAALMNGYLNTVVTALEGLGRSKKIVFDKEVYNGSDGNYPSVANVKMTWAAFLETVRERQVIPCTYPALADHPFVVSLMDTVNGYGECWSEFGFPYPQLYKTKPDKAIAYLASFNTIRLAFKALWPNVVVRQGMFDDILRDFGAPAMASENEFGDDGYWMFDLRRPNTAVFNPTTWFNCTNINSANDVVQSWTAKPNNQDNITAIPGTIRLDRVQLVPAPAVTTLDVTSSYGDLLKDGKCLKALLSFTTNQVFTVSVKFMLPLGEAHGPIFGQCQANTEPWQVIYDQPTDTIYLEVKQPSGNPKKQYALIVKPAKMTTISIVLARDTTSWYYKDTTIVPPTQSGVQGNFYIGGGTKMGTGTFDVFTGLIFQSCEKWNRVLTLAERATAEIDTYPF